ncbi:MAG: glycosyltransferase family 4 protein [Deltaproteobacteria bacterium]|jgi:Fuc2NAc and GlcNAc transferase|nr:glycosyltransferase family 4 protein [Deltaproteobacteria bacterium]
MSEYIDFLFKRYVVDFSANFGYFLACAVLLRTIMEINRSVGLVDVPNSRSSHSQPTPSGGGAAIVLIVLAANWKVFFTSPEFLIGGLILAVVGLMDDIKKLPVLPRLLTQLAVTSAVVVLLPAKAPIMGVPIWAIKAVLIPAGVWFINVYNFMDGLDGLAVGYANAASLGFLYCIEGGLLVESWNEDVYRQLFYITMAFLIFNWSPAKIFMGDIGSTFLGFVFFALGARSLLHGNYAIYSFVIIMSFFWIDATITLTRRFKAGARIFKAHREHAFHKASALFGHWRVSAFIIMVTIAWLNPMAKLAVKRVDLAPVVTLLAVIPILVVIVLFNPGSPKDGLAIRIVSKKFKLINKL